YKQASINGFSSGFDFPAYDKNVAETSTGNFAYNKYLEVEGNSSAAKRELYGSLAWISYPLLAPDQELLSTDVTIRLRVNKEYKNFNATGQNGGKPMYGWSMDQIATQVGSQDMLKEALDLVNVVPNPYYAFSEYERNKLDNRIKITNLPERCQIRIYSSNGKLIRNIKKDSPQTYQDWDLTNHAGIPVASGIYLIHIEVPNVGERVLKAFIALRMVDLQNI
ncbi:MAG: hypothetical protein ACKOWX_08000, partial [Flavobacteriales bacterium]